MPTEIVAIFLSTISPLSQFGLSSFSVIIAILFFRANQRAHTWCLLVGTLISFILTTVQMPILESVFDFRRLFTEGGVFQPAPFFALFGAIGLIAHGLFLYGLFTIALIAYRKSRSPKFVEENETN
ncbi:MAG: hypothetical protein KDN19_04015 [Verrucomicrobiae bacterium]|nr:hypothetical protein [Verrucomicrobiae bacterium]